MGKQIRSDEKTPFQLWYEKYSLENKALQKINPDSYEKDTKSNWKKTHEFAICLPSKVLQEQFESIFKTTDYLMTKVNEDMTYTDEEKAILIEGLILFRGSNHALAKQIIIHQRTQIGIERRDAQKKNSQYNTLYKRDEK